MNRHSSKEDMKVTYLRNIPTCTCLHMDAIGDHLNPQLVYALQPYTFNWFLPSRCPTDVNLTLQTQTLKNETHYFSGFSLPMAPASNQGSRSSQIVCHHSLFFFSSSRPTAINHQVQVSLSPISLFRPQLLYCTGRTTC